LPDIANRGVEDSGGCDRVAFVGLAHRWRSVSRGDYGTIDRVDPYVKSILSTYLIGEGYGYGCGAHPRRRGDDVSPAIATV
jgi:hypothetical protein